MSARVINIKIFHAFSCSRVNILNKFHRWFPFDQICKFAFLKCYSKIVLSGKAI